MSKSFTVAKLCLKLLLRKGSIWGLALGLIGLTTLCFFSAKSDGSLNQELQIRLLYSYGIGYSFVNIAVIALACFSVRNQLDSRNIHQLSALPIKRSSIWIGQSMALFTMALSLLVLLFICLGTCTWLFKNSFPDTDQEKFATEFSQPMRVIPPNLLSDYDLIVQRVAESGGQLMPNMPQETWNAIHLTILTKEQRFEPKESKVFEFDLLEQPQSSHATLYFRPQASGSKPIPYKVELLSDKKAVASHTIENQTMHLQKTYVEIPSEKIPADGRFYIRLTNQFSKAISISRKSGIHVRYDSGTYISNILKAFGSQFAHLYIAVILGMMCGTALTFAVASFTAIVLFCLSISQGFFESIIKDLMFAYEPPLSQVLMARLLESCLWITRGLRPPPVIENLAQNKFIETNYLFFNWLPSSLVYGLLLSVVGIMILTKKELSKPEV